MKKAFTLVELLIVIVIIGILATIAIPQYNKMAEKAKSAEAYFVFDQARKGYLTLRKAAGESTASIDWNPNTHDEEGWDEIGMTSPNANPNEYFTYDVWDNVFSQTQDPVKADKYVIVAFRRNSPGVYTTDYDRSRWLYMDLDTGEVFKSDTYK
jgi:prepilin-type N-terminal cleavage/methylation domain-containing protein